jgi:chaperonin cofactor prefoldin
LLNDESLRQYQTLAETVNNLRMQRANAEQDISVNQRLLNEVDKNIEALQVVVENSSETDQDVLDLLAKFETRRTEIQAALDQAVTDANNYATQASATMDDLRSIATVLR